LKRELELERVKSAAPYKQLHPRGRKGADFKGPVAVRECRPRRIGDLNDGTEDRAPDAICDDARHV
jgi:hypothetical protein